MREIIKRALRAAGRISPVRALLLALIRAALRGTPPGRLRNALVGPVTSYLLPPGFRAQVVLPDGTRFWGGTLDIVTRMILYFGSSPRGCWEPCTAQLAVTLGQGGGDIIIGGAHVGFFAVTLARVTARAGGRVIAFEPAPAMHEELVKNAELNEVSNLTIERSALGARSESGVLFVQGVRSSLVKPSKGPTDHREDIAIVSIDDYVDDHRMTSVSLLFLDVEGAEVQALQGAERLLHEPDAPDVLFEVIPSVHHGRSAAVAYLQSLGYTVLYVADDYDLELRGRPAPLRVRPIDAAPLGHRYFNALATRRAERLASLGILVESVASAA